MKKVSAVILSLIIAATPANLFAAELSDEQIGNISTNCASIKLRLKQIQKNDARSRVNLGAQFEIISTNLMMNLNLRLVKNNIANANVSRQQTEFAAERESFKSDYISYSQELEKLISVNCKDEPQSFYDQLETVRSRRATVAGHVKRLGEMAAEHRKTILDMRDGLTPEKTDE
ncbi:hypothetical protein J6X09_03275 [Candidatus Saccharibacteria bacterium]|nr:hypothetical protein [Candidatus Saccharibacteria bacterium]